MRLSLRSTPARLGSLLLLAACFSLPACASVKSQQHTAADNAAAGSTQAETPTATAAAPSTAPSSAAVVAQAAVPAVVNNDIPGARVPGSENGYPDVNPVFRFTSGRLVCGTRRVPLDIKVEGADDQKVLITFEKKHYLLVRKPTSTGAYHFDDARAGIVLIQIPVKSMLFDKKNMTRLADDCVPASP